VDTLVTVTGNLTADPVQRVTASGAIVVGLRIASSSRRWDREAMQWRDGDAMYISASCWRQLAGNVMAPLRKGDSVVVHGRLSMRTYDDRSGARRSVHEIDAVAIGPDLTRCPAEVRRPPRPVDAPAAAGGTAVTGAATVPEQAAAEPADRDLRRTAEPAVAAAPNAAGPEVASEVAA
jgi:single-strand DNA-binding protein